MEKITRPPLTGKEKALFDYLCEKVGTKPLPSQRLIACAFGVHQTRISQLIARLVAKGYITKKSLELADSEQKGKRK